MEMNSRIIMAYAVLHNFVINHKLGMLNRTEEDNINLTSYQEATEDGNSNEISNSVDIDIHNYISIFYGQEITREIETPFCMNYFPTLGNEDDDYNQTKGISSITREFIVDVIEGNKNLIRI